MRDAFELQWKAIGLTCDVLTILGLAIALLRAVQVRPVRVAAAEPPGADCVGA